MINIASNYMNMYEQQNTRGLKIIKELDEDLVLVKCIHCGKLDKFNKTKVLNNSCICQNCRCGIVHANTQIRKSIVGKRYSNVYVVEEIGGGEVIGECLICNKKYVFKKYSLSTGQVHSCGCGQRRQIVVGNTYNNMEVIAIIDQYNVRAKCNSCGEENNYNINLILNSTVKKCIKCTLKE